MVEITEESSERHDGSPSNSAGATGTSSASMNIPLLEYLKSRSTDTILFLARVVTVFCTLCYISPLSTAATQHSYYSKAFAAAAATNALRLHQRVGSIRFTREFLAQILLEDACHYLLYSVLFITSVPVTMALMPIFLYAILHAASFTVQICNAIGRGTSNYARTVNELISGHTENLLGVIACSEIFIMPLFIAMIFSGKASIFFPFIYYRFLTLRYMSRRNPSTKRVFYQLRVSLEQAVSGAGCPQVIRSSVHAIIAFICRLCPTTA